jgi:hypothetical protein
MAKLTITRGDTRDIDVTFTQPDGTPIDLTGGKVFFTANPDPEPEDDTGASIAVDTTVHTDPANGRSRIKLAHSDTDIPAGLYFYDVQFVDAHGNVTSLRQQRLTVIADITRRTT